ncbi:hypothetical protein RK509_10010, partial [Streptococcus pneumoniae]|nr:hypothetical protein [Streptococcus pneumoniae]
KKHPLGEKRNHPGSKLRQGFWMVFRFGVNNWGYNILVHEKETIQGYSVLSNCGLYSSKIKFKPRQLPSTTSKQCFEQPAASFLVCSLIFIEY